TLRGVRRTLLWTLCEAMEKSAVVRGHLCAPDSLLLLLDVLEHTAATAQTDQDDADQDADQDEHGDDVSAAAPQPPNRPMPQSAGHRQADAVTQMIVGVSGEDAALERLFGSGAVRERLLGILGRDADGAAAAVAAAAALCLGNLARTDAHCEQLVGGHGALVARLVRVWFAARGGADVHVRHAVSGLLKNLCLPAANKQPLADMGLAAAAAANITTAVVPIQANAIGILRHLATGAPAAGTVAQLLRPLADDGAESALQALLRTVRTTDIDGIRCEGTRLVAAVAKKIYLRRAAPAAPADGALLDGARHALEAAALDLVTPLVRLVLLDGQRHPLLQQESLVALTVLAAAGSGVDYAGQITALLDPARSAPLAVPPAAGGDDDEEEPTPAGPARGLAAALRGLLAPEGSVWPQSTLQAKSLVAQLLASSAGAGADAAAGLAILRDELAPLAA
ncbi:Rap1 GTPase-GDP dissociation stimulator 1, partial [Coemansia nantahalensis]